MVDEIKNFGGSIEETAGENIDPKDEIRLGASENIATSLQHEKSNTKEAKETFVKSLEFEENLFNTEDSGLCFSGSTENGYMIRRNGLIDHGFTGDIIEHVGGLVAGDQLLTYEALLREVMKTKNCVQQEVEQKYLMTVDEFEKKMKDKPNGSKEYKKFLSQEIGVHRPGMWIVYDNDLSDVSDVLYIWLVGGNIAYFRDDGCGIIRGCSDCMVSGRLLKN